VLRKRSGADAPAPPDAAEPRAAGAWAEAWRKAHGAALDGRWSEAVDAYTLLVAAERERGAELYLGSSEEGFLARGTARRKVGRVAAALEASATARARWPDAVEPALLLAETYHLLGDTALGHQTLEDLYRLAPASSRDLVAREIAIVYHGLRDYAG